jgi:23S rRNA pseudouridine2605 synthase
MAHDPGVAPARPVKERLQKLLARAGYGSRRSAEQLITEGRVSVNGVAITVLGAQADPIADVVAVDGQPISLPVDHVYLAMHKPAGVLTTAHDPQGRRTVMELLPANLAAHVVPVGRLDRDTTGLLLFTDDGELAHRLAHPRYTIDKEYYALVTGEPGAAALKALRRGVDIGDVRTSPADVRASAPPEGHAARPGHTWLRVVLHEGRKRQVRLMCAAVGHPVRALTRTRVGDVALGRLAPGRTRRLDAREERALRRAVGLDPPGSTPGREQP